MAKWDIAVIGVAAVAIIYLLRQTGKDIAGALGNIKMPDIRMPDIHIPETKIPNIEIKLPENKFGWPDIPGVTGFGSTGGLPNIPGVNYIPGIGTPSDVSKMFSGWYDKFSGLFAEKTPPSSSYFPPSLGGGDSRAAVGPSKGSLEDRMFSSPFKDVFSIPESPIQFVNGPHQRYPTGDPRNAPAPATSLDFTNQGGGNYSTYQEPTRAPLSPRSGWTYDSLADAIRSSGLGLTQSNFGKWYIPGTFVGDSQSGGGSVDPGSIYQQVKLRL